MTQYAGDYYPSIIEQDGLAFGAFTGITIDETGIVTALFDNGQTRDIFQLPIATFRNPNGLESHNGNAYLQTGRSEEHTSELQSLMRTSYAVFSLYKTKTQ